MSPYKSANASSSTLSTCLSTASGATAFGVAVPDDGPDLGAADAEDEVDAAGAAGAATAGAAGFGAGAAAFAGAAAGAADAGLAAG